MKPFHILSLMIVALSPLTHAETEKPAGDDKNAPVVEREYTNPYGRSDDGSRVRTSNPR